MKLKQKSIALSILAFSAVGCDHHSADKVNTSAPSLELEAVPNETILATHGKIIDVALQLSVRVDDEGKTLGFWSGWSVVGCGPDHQNCVSMRNTYGNLDLSHSSDASVRVTIQIVADGFAFYSDPTKSISIGLAADGVPPPGAWNPEFEQLSVSSSLTSLTFIDDNDPGTGPYEYSVTVLNTATGQPFLIDPKISNKNDNK